MVVFVSEYVCGGALAGTALPASLAIEGRAMLEAIVADFARVSDCEVVTTLDVQLADVVALPPTVTVEGISDAGHEAESFRRLCTAADATLVVAPEFDGLLTRRCRIVEASGRTLLGPTSDAVALCSDKQRLARHLQERGLATIATQPFDPASPSLPPFAWPIVVKPRDGAGSLGVRRLNDARELASFVADLDANVDADLANREWIVQPFARGDALSVATIVSSDGMCVETCPVGRQRLSDDGRFRYLGGRIPADGSFDASARRLVVDVVAAVPGLRGWFGCDLLGDAATLTLVEINPRLTTSYLGYRALANVNLAERMLARTRPLEPLTWRTGIVEFEADGRIAPV